MPPGTRALLSKGRLQFDRYWDPAPVGRPLQWLTPEEASGFDDVFERAVKRCLCHGQTGIFLSGGLDFISVAAVAADGARASGQSARTCPVTRTSAPRMQRAGASGSGGTRVSAFASSSSVLMKRSDIVRCSGKR